jgi:hypothetical protein
MMDKQQRKAATNKWKLAGRAELIARMPITPDQLHCLLDHLDKNLEACDHTTKQTADYLNAEKLDREKTLTWLGEQGGYCDCEILANLTELDESLQKQPVTNRKITPKQPARTPRSLNTVNGWNLRQLVGAWRVANLYDSQEPIRLELGKKGGCMITIVESALPDDNQSLNSVWTQLWFDRTSLPPRDDLQVYRDVLNLGTEYHSILVRSASWIPVYCWIIPKTGDWHLEVRTELDRYNGDLPQIASLISFLTRA